MSKKFFSGGLKFECNGCGACCSLPEGSVEITAKEADLIASFLSLEIDEFFVEYCILQGDSIKLKDNQEKHCIFFKENRCLVYAMRPLQCRTFPFWPENLKSRRRWENLKTFCEGINQGKTYPAKEITSVFLLQKKQDKKSRKNAILNQNPTK